MSPVHRTAEDDEISPGTLYIVGMLREQITGVVNQINGMEKNITERLDRLNENLQDTNKRVDKHEQEIREIKDPPISQVKRGLAEKEAFWEKFWKWAIRIFIVATLVLAFFDSPLATKMLHLFQIQFSQ